MTKRQLREHKIGNQLRKNVLLSQIKHGILSSEYIGSMIQDGKHKRVDLAERIVSLIEHSRPVARCNYE